MVLLSDQKESVQGVEKEFSWPTIKIGILVVNVDIQSLKKEHNKKSNYKTIFFQNAGEISRGFDFLESQFGKTENHVNHFLG